MPNATAAQERCPKYPSMLKAYCTHCRGTEHGTTENPRFSLQEEDLNGCPIVEVLKNGGPVHSFDRNFRFGVRKAQMILACVGVLHQFWQSTDEQRLAFEPQVIEDQRHRLRVRIHVEMHPDFELSSGQIVDRPWLRLRALPPDNEHIGVGAIKCRALCELRDDLAQWLRRQGVLE